MKEKLIVLLLIAVLGLFGCSDKKEDLLKVAVSIVPQETFVKAIAGDLIDVVVMIPPGFSPANYEPSPKQMADFNDAALYFQIDVPAEVHILDSIHNDQMKIVDLADLVDEVYPARYFDADISEISDDGHNHEGRDPHIWLSPKRMVVMVEAMRDELILLAPEHSSEFVENAKQLIDELNALDHKIAESFSTFDQKSFIIYHPSYGYFADDYNLNMIAIEVDGKEATIKDLEHVVELARDQNIKVIFYQEEFDSQQAKVISKEIDGVAIQVAPLSGDYFNEMDQIIEKLKDIFQ